MRLDALAIGAHADDIELSCGGTVAKLVRMGCKVGIVDLTQGELGTRGSKEIRRKEAAAAARILGVSIRENLKIQDGNIEVNQKNILRLIRLIRKFRPTVLLIPHWLERHPDHEHTHQLCKEAWFYAGLEKIKTLENGKLQQPFRPAKYFHFMQKYEFIPSFIINVTNEFDIRMKAIGAYKSQLYDPESKERQTLLSTPEFIQFIVDRAKYYGTTIGVKYGEPFYSVDPIGINDLFSLILSRS